ncbi:hypothetical protein [Rhizobium leguminosarum]|uniref:hypothetical protein n=1 Tax=Rhizobium leguminosarum TaxID=384 RepID=UPI003F9E5A58
MRTDQEQAKASHGHGMIWPEPGDSTALYWMPLIKQGLAVVAKMAGDTHRRLVDRLNAITSLGYGNFIKRRI